MQAFLRMADLAPGPLVAVRASPRSGTVLPFRAPPRMTDAGSGPSARGMAMTRRQRIFTAAAMILAGPAIVMLGVVLSELDAPDPLVSGVQVAGGTGGMAVAVGGVAILLRALAAPYCGRIALAAIPLFVVSVLLHNVISGLTGIEEPVFFLLAVIVAPALLLGGTLAAIIPRHGPPGGAGLQPG